MNRATEGKLKPQTTCLKGRWSILCYAHTWLVCKRIVYQFPYSLNAWKIKWITKLYTLACTGPFGHFDTLALIACQHATTRIHYFASSWSKEYGYPWHWYHLVQWSNGNYLAETGGRSCMNHCYSNMCEDQGLVLELLQTGHDKSQHQQLRSVRQFL